MTRIWTKEDIRALLETNDKMVERSLLKMYDRQEDDEKAAQETRKHNSVGFNGADAPILSSIAQQLTNKGWISQKQRELCRKKLMKYAGQLAEIANDTNKTAVAMAV